MAVRPVKEPAIGVVDGVNRVFQSTRDYKPGTAVAFLNGQARPERTTELGGKTFELELAPKVDDQVVIYYVTLSYLFENLSGTIDGVNDTFSFSAPYTPGTTAIYLNGQLLLVDGTNPWVELDPSAGTIRITEAGCIPRAGAWGTDEIAGFALDTAAPAPETVIDRPLMGVIKDKDALTGTLSDGFHLAATLQDVDGLTGRIDDVDLMRGEVADDQLTGTTKDC